MRSLVGDRYSEIVHSGIVCLVGSSLQARLARMKDLPTVFRGKHGQPLYGAASQIDIGASAVIEGYAILHVDALPKNVGCS